MAPSPTTTRRSYDQDCPVAHTLDLVGERWTLLVVRDLMFGPLRFGELRDGLPGLAPNLLSERLRLLVDRGIVRRAQLPGSSRAAYELTEQGRELAPVIHELARFGVRGCDPVGAGPPRRLLRGALLALMRPDRLGVASWTATLELPEGTVGLEVRRGRRDDASVPLERLRLTDPAPSDRTPDVRVRTDLDTLVAIDRGRLDPGTASGDGRLQVEGPDRAVSQLRRLMCWD